MIDDPILEEIYSLRQQDAERYEFDVAKMFADLRQQVDDSHEFITTPLRPHRPWHASVGTVATSPMPSQTR